MVHHGFPGRIEKSIEPYRDVPLSEKRNILIVMAHVTAVRTFYQSYGIQDFLRAFPERHISL
jgi:hypothetical protein